MIGGMVLRATLCAHCRREAAAETCAHCGSAVCAGCARDDGTCTVPRVRVLRLGLGRRLRRVDPEARVGLVSSPTRRYHEVFDLVSGVPIEPTCQVPVQDAAWLPAIAHGGRVIWPAPREPEPGEFTALGGLVVASVRERAVRVIEAATRTSHREVGLCPSGRHAWVVTRSETAQVWDLEAGAQHEYTPFPAAVLQSTALDEARGILACGTYGRVSVLRLEGARVTQLATLHLPGATNLWIALSGACMVVVSDLGGNEGYALRAFALGADGVPEGAPFHVVPEVVMNAVGERRLQRPLVATLSQGGRYLAVAMRNRAIAVHDLQHGRVQHLSGHTDRVAMIAFTADTRSLVTSDHDNRVIVWPRRDEIFLDLAPDRRR
jgi:hypothetical protein